MEVIFKLHKKLNLNIIIQNEAHFQAPLKRFLILILICFCHSGVLVTPQDGASSSCNQLSCYKMMYRALDLDILFGMT